MNRKPKTVAKAALLLTLTAIDPPVQATGIPVIDVANLQQNLTTAMESAAQTAKQIEQYTTQLRQYENMLVNSAALPAYLWSQANGTISALLRSIDTLNAYKQQAGGIDAYLSKYQSMDYYRSSPCLSAGGCSTTEWRALQEAQTQGSAAQKKANDAMFRGLDRQQTQLQQDAKELSRLQENAQTAQGQMAAIQYANQLASQEANQLMHIRGLLIAQQNADATRAQVIADREARELATHEVFTERRIAQTNAPKKW